jgi:uncharacterized RDD family membrane protein YckC
LAFAFDLTIVLGVFTACGPVFVVVQAITGVTPTPSSFDDLAPIAFGYGLGLAAYLTLFWSLTGRTPGLRILKLELATLSGERLRPRRCLLRFAGMVLAALPLFAGYLLILFNDRRQGLQDLIAGTIVRYSSADEQPLSLAAARARSRQRFGSEDPPRELVLGGRLRAHPAGDESDNEQHDDHADDGAQDPAEVEGIVVADPEAAGEDHVPDEGPKQAEQDRDGP